MRTENLCSEHSGICKKTEAIQKEVDIRFTALEKSIQSTKNDLDIRLEAMNEFRAQLDRQANTFVPRQEISLSFEKLHDKIEAASSKLNDKIVVLSEISSEKRGATKWTDHIITALIGLGVIIIVALLV